MSDILSRDELAATLDDLRADLACRVMIHDEALHAERDAAIRRAEAAESDWRAAEAEAARLRDVLTFYADDANWEVWPSTAGPARRGHVPKAHPELRIRGGGVGGQMMCPSTCEQVRGQVARAALGESAPNTEGEDFATRLAREQEARSRKESDGSPEVLRHQAP